MTIAREDGRERPDAAGIAILRAELADYEAVHDGLDAAAAEISAAAIGIVRDILRGVNAGTTTLVNARGRAVATLAYVAGRLIARQLDGGALEAAVNELSLTFTAEMLIGAGRQADGEAVRAYLAERQARPAASPATSSRVQ